MAIPNLAKFHGQNGYRLVAQAVMVFTQRDDVGVSLYRLAQSGSGGIGVGHYFCGV